jgi:hypothetical protein
MSRRISIFGASFASLPVFQAETTAYMNAIAVPADGTLYYPSTIYERTGLQLWQAFDAFVVTGKSAGWWSTLIAFYPYIGGTATAHKFNAVNPLDTDAAYRAQFLGSVTHSATGVQGNGVNGYANTFFNDQSAAIDRDDIGITMYSRTGGFSTGVDMGAVGSSTFLWLFIYRSQGSSLIGAYDNGAFNVSNALTGDSLGAFTLTRHPSAVDTQSFYRNGNPIADRTSFPATAYTNLSMFLMCRNLFGSPNLYSQRNYSAHVIHEGMTAADVASFHGALQTLQTALGRQV